MGLIARIQDSNVHYYLHNAHGDVVQLVDQNGTKLRTYRYDAFGNEKDANENDVNPFRYCGEYWDKETETLYLRNRNYDPRIGRFGAMDPVGDGTNWYTYCGGNPVAFVDPLGLKSYVIYSYVSENKVAAQTIAKQLEKKYGTDSEVRHAKSAKDFVRIWNELSELDDIDEIQIITHGHVTYNDKLPDLGESVYDDFGIGFLQFQDERTGGFSVFYSDSYKSSWEDDANIDEIKPAKMEQLHLLSCNTANPDFKSNLVQAFYDKNPDIASVSGYDGGVAYYDKTSGFNVFKWGTEMEVTTDIGNPTLISFRRVGDDPERERQGLVVMTRPKSRGQGGKRF